MIKGRLHLIFFSLNWRVNMTKKFIALILPTSVTRAEHSVILFMLFITRVYFTVVLFIVALFIVLFIL